MSITLDAASALLRACTVPVILVDESGRTLGRFIPERSLRWEPPPLSREELERRMREPGYSFAEVIAHLESLDERGPDDAVGDADVDAPLYVEHPRSDEDS
jgi:NADPH-dependent 2,4-dienoyl-CoA reductase/sulfur reductase-like enzyme